MALKGERRMLLIFLGLTILSMESYAKDELTTTTSKISTNAQDSSSTTSPPAVTSGNDKGAEHDQTEQTRTTSSPAENQADAGGSANAAGNTTDSGGFGGNDKDSGTSTTGRTGEGVPHTDAPQQSGKNNQDGTNSTPAQSFQGSYATTSGNYADTGRSENATGTTIQRGDLFGNDKHSNSGTSTTGRTGEDAAHTNAPQQSGTNNQDETNSTPAQSGQWPSDHKVTEQSRNDSAGSAYTSTGMNQQTATPTYQQNMDSKGRKGSTERPSTQASNQEDSGQTQIMRKEEGAHLVTSHKDNGGDNMTYKPTTEDTRDIGGKENDDDRTSTNRPEDTHQGSQQQQITTTVPNGHNDPSDEGSATNAPMQDEHSEHTASTLKSITNNRHHTEAPPDQEKHVSVKTTPQSTANEKPSTSASSSHGEEQLTTPPKTTVGQRPSTERPSDREDGDRGKTTVKSVTEEGGKKGTVGPKVEGGGDHGKSTPTDETGGPEHRHVTTNPPNGGVKPTQMMGGESSTTNTTTVYSLPRLALVQSELTLSDEDDCTSFTLTFTIPPSREGGISSKPTQSSGTDDDSGTDGDGETAEVISYEDFSDLMGEQFSLPDNPVLLRGPKGRNMNIKVDEAMVESANNLVVKGSFCDMRSTMLEICLSFDGRTRVRTQDAPTGKCHNFTVYAGAPALSSARLSDMADAVVIFFNKDVNISNLRNCSAIFDQATLDLFGKGSECQWRQGKELVVRLSQRSTIMTGSPIALRTDRIRAFKQRFSRTSNGSLDVLAPNTPVTPTARIHGEPKVPACGAVRLSARKSAGGGSRGLTYTWSLQSPSQGFDDTITDILQEANDANKAGLVVSASLLSDVTPYEWRLDVRNIQDLEHFTTFTVQKAADGEPKFRIGTTGIPEANPVKITSRVSLFGDISFNRGPGCPRLNSSLVQFQWAISGAQFEEGVIQTNKRILKFPPRTLPGKADINATLTATYEAETTMTLTKSVTFTTAYEPLMARIKGGERITTGVGSAPFTLDCSLSRDPNFKGEGPDDGLTFRWSCWQETDKTKCFYTETDGGETITLPTTDQGSAQSMLTVDPSMLTAGKVYSFPCYVNKEELWEELLEKHDSVTVTVTENDPPMISLALLKSKNGAYRPGSDVEIRATVSGDDVSKLQWTDVGGGLDGFGEDTFMNVKDTTKTDEETTVTTSNATDSKTKPYSITIRKKDATYYSLLTMRKGRLEAGSRYELEFSAINAGEMGTSSVTFLIPAKVTGCQFEFGGNESYADTATDVKYAVQACSADEDSILTYQAFATFPVDETKSSIKLLGQTSEYPEIEVDHEVLDRVKRKIADGEEVDFQVGVRVCYQDSKICADFKKAVTYVHVPLTAQQVDAKKEEINDLKKEGRPVEGLKTANSVQNARAEETAGPERRKRATFTFDQELLALQKDLLIIATGDTGNYDGYVGDVQLMIELATQVPIQEFSRAEIREIVDADKVILESAQDLDERLPQDTLDGVRQHLEDSKGAFTDRKFFTENRDIIGLLSKCMSKDLVMGERATSDGTEILIAIEATLNIDPLSITKGDGDITFNAGDDVRNRYDASWEGCGCDDCVGVLVEFLIYRGQDYVAGESHASDVIGLQFVNPCTGDPLDIQDLTDPAYMSIPFSSPWSSDAHPVCSYYNTDTMDWRQDGVATFVDGMDVVCKTNHTTDYVIDFVVVDGGVPEPTVTTTEGGKMTTEDDDDDGTNSPGINGLLGLGIGAIVGIVVGSLVALAIIIILLAVIIKNLNKPKMIIEPIVKA